MRQIVIAAGLAIGLFTGGASAAERGDAVMLKMGFENGVPASAEQIGGRWQAVEGRLLQADPDGVALLVAGEPDWNDYTATTRVRLPKGASRAEAGLALQVRDQQNYVVFSLKRKEGGAYAVLRIEDPELRVVGDQGRLRVSLDEWHEIKADVHGVDIYCYVDGKHVCDYSFAGTPPAYNDHGKTWKEDLTKGRVGLVTVGAQAEFDDLTVRRLADFSHIITPQKGRWDGKKLLPRQSYAETMRRFTEWLTGCDKVMDKSAIPQPIRDLPPYLLASFGRSDDNLPGASGEFAFNHAVTITGAVRYYAFSGDRECLKIATTLADWDIANSTPADAAMPYLPPSTVFFQADGSWKGADWGLEPDKSAYMGIGYLKLYAVTGQRKYLDAALRLAGTLLKLQQPDGSWPFRINPKTGSIESGYTCSQLWYVWFFEQLSIVTGDKSYMRPRDRAFHWLLKNPIKTNRWTGVYGDIDTKLESFDQWVALESAIYLVDHRSEDPGYVRQAEQMLDWVNRTLVVDYGFFPGVPGVLEQTVYKVVLTHHQLRLAEVNAKLWEATGKRDYKDKAIQYANSVTWCLMSDGKMRQGFWYHAIGIPLVICFNDQFCRIMASIPETAPDKENHLLQTTGVVKRVNYEKGLIRYGVIGKSTDILKVACEPKSVSCGGRQMERLTGPTDARDGWSYDAKTKLLRIEHTGPDVEVAF